MRTNEPLVLYVASLGKWVLGWGHPGSSLDTLKVLGLYASCEAAQHAATHIGGQDPQEELEHA